MLLLYAIFVLLADQAVEAASCTNICRPPQDLVAPCGPAYSEWLASGGYAQTGLCDAPVTTLLNPFCGSQPVKSIVSFSFAAPVSTVYNATFSTADGSCTCNSCYNIETFDQTYYSTFLPTCWTPQPLVFPADFAVWNQSSRYFQSPPLSLGLDLTGPWPNPGSNTLTSRTVTSGGLTFLKNRLRFWLKVVNLNATAGEYVRLEIFNTAVLLGTNLIQPAWFHSCPYNYNSGGNLGWSGNLECTVEIDLSFAFPAQLALFKSSLQWVGTYIFQPKTITTISKRVSPPVTTITYPVSGVWIDDINICGDNLPLPIGP